MIWGLKETLGIKAINVALDMLNDWSRSALGPNQGGTVLYEYRLNNLLSRSHDAYYDFQAFPCHIIWYYLIQHSISLNITLKGKKNDRIYILYII